MVAGNPKIYGQLVTLLAPHTRVIKDAPREAASAAPAAPGPADATDTFVAAVAPAATITARKPPVRIRKQDAARDNDPA